ncbi:PDZ domain-containing protein [Glutamicibacter endophyticus]|uniref:YlbL family protein n=1 Tax=Glutamicibacter endophyticus TaxID=1522174 RepID=UPI003AF15753
MNDTGHNPTGGHQARAIEPVPAIRSVRKLNAGTVAVILVALILLLPTNFVVRSPGPVVNTMGEVDGQRVLTVDRATTYPSQSTLDMTTVYVSGGGQHKLSGVWVLEALLNPGKDVVPEEIMLPRGVSSDQQAQENSLMMSSSQELSTAAALHELGHDYDTSLQVVGFAADYNKTSLQENDVLVDFEGSSFADLKELKELLNKSESDEATMTVRRVNEAGKMRDVQVPVHTVLGEDGQRQLGVYLRTGYQFPIDVKFGVEDIGGPSAGMMFALAIIDQLTEGSLAGDTVVAGTGEISEDGQVGPIGGIAQKMIGAREAGATVFLAPEDNCPDVAGRVPKGLDVVKVATLHEARSALQAIAQGIDPATLTSCN